MRALTKWRHMLLTITFIAVISAVRERESHSTQIIPSLDNYCLFVVTFVGNFSFKMGAANREDDTMGRGRKIKRFPRRPKDFNVTSFARTMGFFFVIGNCHNGFERKQTQFVFLLLCWWSWLMAEVHLMTFPVNEDARWIDFRNRHSNDHNYPSNGRHNLHKLLDVCVFFFFGNLMWAGYVSLQ